MNDTPKRRSTHVDVGASYAAVGASQAPDLMRFPPEGSTPYHEEVLLGSGDDRYIIASTSLMTWGAQKNAGITVEQVQDQDVDVYPGVNFTRDGVPELPATNEKQFAPDGTAFLSAGNVVRLTWQNGRQREVRVVSTIDEQNRVGFVIGTTDDDWATGEEFFCVEKREDGTVWGIVRGFLKPTKDGMLGLKGKSIVKSAISGSRDQIRALTPANTAHIASTQTSESDVRLDSDTGSVIVVDPSETGSRDE